jgi:hypothetical protein
MAISQPLLKTKTTWYVAAAVFLILSIKPTYKALRKWGYYQVTETASFFETVGNYTQ